MSDRIRLTITVSREAHEVFTRMSEAAGQSLGRVMGDWLDDTIEGAQFVSLKMQEARKAPKVVMREMHAMAQGLVAELDADARAMRTRTAREAAKPRPGRPGPASPPSSNTGGKVPGKTRRRT